MVVTSSASAAAAARQRVQAAKYLAEDFACTERVGPLRGPTMRLEPNMSFPRRLGVAAALIATGAPRSQRDLHCLHVAMAWRLSLCIFIMDQSRFSLKIAAIAAQRRIGRGTRVRVRRRGSATPRSRVLLGLESWRGLLWPRSECGLGERVEQLDCSAGDAKDLTTATSQGNPRFERRDTLCLETLDQRLRQIMWQCMRHGGQSSQSV